VPGNSISTIPSRFACKYQIKVFRIAELRVLRHGECSQPTAIIAPIKRPPPVHRVGVTANGHDLERL
jgi:hypothetical protein